MGNTQTVTIDGRVLEVKEKVGEGAYALVYKVMETTTGSLFVLKRMQVNKDNDIVIASVRNEVKVMSSLPPHRNIVRYVTSEFRNAPDYLQVDILMECCPGGSAVNKLKEAQETGTRIPEVLIMRWLRDVSAALAHMHSQSPPIAHRDLKAENMLLAADGTVKLCDFGSATTRAGVYDTFAEIAEEESIVDRTTTLHYRAPELADLHVMPRNRIDEKVDIWALGVLAYRLAYFVTPFEDAGGNALRMGILSGKFKIPGDNPYSDVLTGFIHTCLEVDPAKRPSIFDIREMFWPESAAATSGTAGLASRRGLSGGHVRPALPVHTTVVAGSSPSVVPSSHPVPIALPAPPPPAQVSLPPPEHLIEIEGTDADGWPQGTTDFQDVDLSSVHPVGPPPPPRSVDDSELLAGNAAAFAMLGLGGDHESRSAPSTPAVVPASSHHTPSAAIQHGSRSQQPPRHTPQTGAVAKHHQFTPKPQSVSVRAELVDFITTGAFTATPVESEYVPDSTSAKMIRGAQTVMESVQTRVLGMMGAEKDKLRWVIKATSLSPGPAKLKYLRFLVVDAWETKSGGALVQYLSRRPLRSEAPVAVKSLVALMKLWHQGPPEAVSKSWNSDIPDVVTMAVDHWKAKGHATSGAASPLGRGAGFGLPVFIAAFGTLALQKLVFHDRWRFLDGQYHRMPIVPSSAEVSSPTPRRDQIVQAIQGMLSLLTTLLSLNETAMGVIVRVYEYNRAQQAKTPALTSANAGLAPGAPRVTPTNPLQHGIGSDEIAIVAGALPTLVVEGWGLYRGCFELLQRTDPRCESGELGSLRSDLDAKLKPLREFFVKLGNAAAKHSIHPCLDVLTAIPALPESSPFSDTDAATSVLSIARHEGVGLTADFVSMAGTPAPGTQTALGRLQSQADALREEDDEDDDETEADSGRDDTPSSLPGDDPEISSILAAIGSDANGVGMRVADGVQAVITLPGNGKCSECLAPRPKWASVNLGVLFCIRCSGLHRRIGVHITQVRSLTLDTWQPGWVLRCLRVGNVRAAKYWEARLPSDARPSVASTMEDVEVFLRKKYEQRLWAASGPSPDEVLQAGGSVPVSAKPVSQPAKKPSAQTQSQTRPPIPRSAPVSSHSSPAPPVAAPHSVSDDPFTHNSGVDPFAGFDDVKPQAAGQSTSHSQPLAGATASSADEFDPFADATQRTASKPSPHHHPPTFTSTVFGSQWGVGVVPAAAPVAPTVASKTVVTPTSAVHAWPEGSEGGLIDFHTPAATAPPTSAQPFSATASSVVSTASRALFPGQSASVPQSVAPSSAGGNISQFFTARPISHAQPPVFAMASPPGHPGKADAFRSWSGVKATMGSGDRPLSRDAESVVLSGSSSKDVITPARRSERSRSFGSHDDTPDLIALGSPALFNPFESMIAAAAVQAPAVPPAGTALTAAPFKYPIGSPSSQPPEWMNVGSSHPVATSVPGFGGLMAGVGENGKAVLKMPGEAGAGSMWTSGVEIPWSAITLGERIGAGGFAEVFRARYKGEEVAVKRLLHKPGAAGDKAVEDFKGEVAMMTRLHHKNIVRFIGVVVTPLCMVTEFCSRGNLFDLLHNPSVPLSWSLRKRMALDAARGMAFLHSSEPIIIHRDLKSLNLLVDADWNVKVSDFGLSRFKALTSSGLMTAQCGTFHWMAPEVIAGHKYTEKADVYSFGIDMWELLTRAIPFTGLQPMQVAMAVLTRGLRPAIPPDCPRDYALLMEACWQTEPELRPTFIEITERLAHMLDR